MVTIDAHQHHWDPSRVDYDWLPKSDPLHRTLDQREIEQLYDECGVDAAVLVQAADSDAETDHLLAVAATTRRVVGVVAWMPLDSVAGVWSRRQRWASEPLLVGVRAMTHDLPDPEWLLREDVLEGLSVLQAEGIPLDLVCADPEGLEVFARVLERLPSLRVVIDHLGKPPLDAGPDEIARWQSLLRRCAEFPNVTAKISGFHARGAPGAWTADQVARVVDIAVDALGPARLMAGGDWPISERSGGYRAHWAAVQGSLSELTASEQQRILGGTATDFYNIDRAVLARATEGRPA